MNLIEQLGGYDVVKSIRKKKTSNQYLDFNGRQMHFLRIDRELLQYRRENNIFEIGDFVVNEIPETISALFQVETLTPKLKKPKTLKCGRWGNYPVGCNSVRHATDKEIAQGYRDE